MIQLLMLCLAAQCVVRNILLALYPVMKVTMCLNQRVRHPLWFFLVLRFQDSVLRELKAQCYSDIDRCASPSNAITIPSPLFDRESCAQSCCSAFYGSECKASSMARENCAMRCVAPECYDKAYSDDPVSLSGLPFFLPHFRGVNPGSGRKIITAVGVQLLVFQFYFLWYCSWKRAR